MADTAKAIADATRRALIEELHARKGRSLFDLCVALLGRDFAASRQAVSKHIAVLEEAELVTIRKVGRTNIHHLDTTRLGEVIAWLVEHTASLQEER